MKTQSLPSHSYQIHSHSQPPRKIHTQPPKSTQPLPPTYTGSLRGSSQPGRADPGSEWCLETCRKSKKEHKHWTHTQHAPRPTSNVLSTQTL